MKRSVAPLEKVSPKVSRLRIRQYSPNGPKMSRSIEPRVIPATSEGGDGDTVGIRNAERERYSLDD